MYAPRGSHDGGIDIDINIQTIKIPEGFHRQFGYRLTAQEYQDSAVAATAKLAGDQRA